MKTMKPISGTESIVSPSMLLEIFDEPIVVQRWAVRATGSITAAVMISHALEISQRMGESNDGWFSMTITEWEKSVGLSRPEQKTARAHLVDIGLLQERRVGMPAHLEYRVDHARVFQTIQRQADRFVDRRDEPPTAQAPRCSPPYSNTEPRSQTSR
jgi:hypothetical protein